MNKMLSNKKTIAIFILPAILIFTLIIPVPLIMSVGLSFFDWDLLSKAKFVGIRNFVKLFTRDDIFRMSIGNTFQYLGLSILFQIPLAYFLAILLTRGKRFEKLVRNPVFMPAIISGTAVSLIFYFIYHPEVGLLNAFLKMIGQEDLVHFWLADSKTAMLCVCIAVAWQWIGYHMVIFVTGITSISTDMIEAARIDGANSWQLTTKIITPNMKPVLRVSIVLITTSSFKAFDSIYVMTGGGPVNSTHMLSTYSYKLSFELFKYSKGSAAANVLLVILLIVGLFYIKITDEEEA